MSLLEQIKARYDLLHSLSKAASAGSTTIDGYPHCDSSSTVSAMAS